jgi:putative transposase
MNWPHAPAHWLFEEGLYIVTARTYNSAHHFSTAERRDVLLEQLFDFADDAGWQLHAWAVMSNHYHLVSRSPGDAGSLRRFIGKLHMKSASEVNRLDQTSGRKVWHQYWDTRLTYPESYFARLHYVHANPSHHGIVANSEAYRWCSASWFRQNASEAFLKTVYSFRIDGLKVPDDF